MASNTTTTATTTTTTTTPAFSSFAALLGKWSGDCQLVDLLKLPSTLLPTGSPSPANAVITVKASVVAGLGLGLGATELLELRLSCTTSDGLTSKEEFTFSPSAPAPAPAADFLRCVKYTGAKYADAGISLQAEGQGLYLLKVVPTSTPTLASQEDLQEGYLRVQTFHVTSAGEFVSSWQTYDRAPQAGAKAPRQLSGVGIFKASPVMA